MKYLAGINVLNRDMSVFNILSSNGVKLSDLPLLNDNDLKALGIHQPIVRALILRGIYIIL